MAGFKAIRWAREVPTLLHGKRVDKLAHYVLLIMATYAKADGSNVFVSVTRLAQESHSSLADVEQALKRLEDAGLIKAECASNGALGWSLNVAAEIDRVDVLESREERRRTSARERQQRWRDRRKAERNAENERYVTPESTVMKLPHNAEDGRYVTPNSCVTKGDVTHELGVSNASESVIPAGQSTYNSIELHKDELHKDELHYVPSERASADATAASDTEPTDAEIIEEERQGTLVLVAAPEAKPKKRAAKAKDPAKEAAAQDIATRYYEAMHKAVPFMGVRQVVRHMLDTFTQQQVFDGVKIMATERREKPLTRQTLLNAIESLGNGSRPGSGQSRASNGCAYGGKAIKRTRFGVFDLTGLSTGDQRLAEAELGKDNPDWNVLREAFDIENREIKESA